MDPLGGQRRADRLNERDRPLLVERKLITTRPGLIGVANVMAPATEVSNPLEFDHLPDTWNPQAFVPRRPVGLALFCAAMAFVAVVAVVASIFYFIGHYAPSWLPFGGAVSAADVIAGLSPLTAALLLVLAGTILGVATALWRQEPWALYTTYVGLIGGMAYLLATGTFVVLLLVLAVVFLYLVSVRHYFY